MSVGKEHLHRIHESLSSFEAAIKEREHPGLMRDKTGLQQEVDKARQRVVEVVLEVVAAERKRT
ncbi:MAG TPA: hypothetical protein VFK78_11060 [Gemmatimonadales bacterium]|nr:hypothetical protein [Gemmatimonadales bacterium]